MILCSKMNNIVGGKETLLIAISVNEGYCRLLMILCFRWNKIDNAEMDWDGLEAVCGPSGAAEVHLRASSTSLQNCGVAVALAHNNPMVLPKIPPPPPPPKAIQQAQRILNHHTTSNLSSSVIIITTTIM